MSLTQQIAAFLVYGREQRGYAKTTLFGYSSNLDCFERWLETEGVTDCQNITRAHIERYDVSGGADGIRPRTRRRRIAAIRAFTKWAHELELMPNDPGRIVKLPRNDDPTRTAPTVNEKAALIDGCTRLRSPYRGHMAATLVAVMCYAGLRPAEAVALELDDVLLDRRRIVVKRGKGGKRREVPINSSLAEHLVNWLTRRRADPSITRLFTPTTARPLSYQGLTLLFREVKVAAGLRDADHLTPHCLRHWFASALRDNGQDLVTIQKLLGHENLNTTQSYLRVLPSELDRAVDTLDGPQGRNLRPPLRSIDGGSNDARSVQRKRINLRSA